jgi:hypothetical protein
MFGELVMIRTRLVDESFFSGIVGWQKHKKDAYQE